MSDTTPPRLSGILQKLMAKAVPPPAAGADPLAGANTKFTGLGVPVVKQENGSCFVDMSEVKVFSGMAEFVHVLMGRFAEEYNATHADILFHQPVNPDITPELTRLGVTTISVTARSGAARLILAGQQTFQRHLRSVFYAVQTAQWGGLLFPHYYQCQPENGTAENKELPALLFSFHAGNSAGAGYLILLEYDSDGKFLRLTVENAQDCRLNLKRIHHRAVANIERQSPFIDIDKTTAQLYQAIHRECQNQQNEFTEIPARQPELFETLGAAGLPGLQKIVLRWNIETMRQILLRQENGSREILSRILYLLEDADIASILASGRLLEMVSGGSRVYLDLSRAGACLNISLEERRHEASMSSYLARMPVLEHFSKTAENRLAGTRLLLIHHATSEMLGMIEALNRAGCAHMTTLFIKYKGIVPDNYIEALFTLPQARFQFHSLQRIAAANSVDAAYVMSNQYSPSGELKRLDEHFLAARPDFMKAMQTAAAHLFFMELLAAKANNQKLLLIEDGGYLAPLINTLCLDSKTVGQAMTALGIIPLPTFADTLEQAALLPLKQFIANTYCGSVEHTRNGFDMLEEICLTRDGLAFPALTIAISKLKNTEEARECATSILNAFETILHSRGLLTSSRNVLVLGCRGNIGRNLMRQTAHRMHSGKLCGVDLAASDSAAREFAAIDAVPEADFLNIDTVIGVTGRSILKQGQLEKLALRGTKRDLFFVSGSTKTAEFEDLARWLNALQLSPAPEIAGTPVHVSVAQLKDPQTGVVQGNRVRLLFGHTPACGLPYKDLYLLGDLMPLNFLYYGVPTELMDLVFTQLMRLILGFTDKVARGEPLPCRVLAVDREIDEQAILTNKKSPV